MLLQQENWRLGYHQILSDCRNSNGQGGGTVLILCNPDADALCAARILSYALRADKVPYQLRPCGGYKCLLSILEKLDLNPDYPNRDDYGNDYGFGSVTTIRVIVLLNLGATKNLQKALFEPRQGESTNEQNENGDSEVESKPSLLNRDQTKIYVLDSHRPYHLANVHASKNIVLWNDYDSWHIEEGGMPSDGDGLSGESDDESSSEEEDSDDDDTDTSEDDAEGEAEFEDDVDIKRKEKEDVDTSGEDSATEGDDNVSVESNTGKRSSALNSSPDNRKRQRSDPGTPEVEGAEDHDAAEQSSKSGNVISMRQEHQDRRIRIRNYYTGGAFHSSPVAFIAYTLLAEQLRHDSVGDLLWLACIGVTDAFIHNRLDTNGYIKMAMILQEKIDQVYPDLNSDDRIGDRIANTIYAEDLYGIDNYKGPMTQVGFSDNGRVFYQRDEFRFFLLRHTSLWDAMNLSPDLNTKMQLWKSSGITRLREMLADMGLPLEQCQQPYAFMKPTLKRRLRNLMAEHEEKYGLEQLKYTAFLRVSGYRSLLSASDMSLAVTALLECDTKKTENTLGSQNVDSNDQDTSLVDKEVEQEKSLMSSFNVAYDALNSNATMSVGDLGGSIEGADLSTIVNGGDVTGNTGLGAGVRLAIAVQKTIITTAVGLVERKDIRRNSHFRFAYLHSTSQGANGGSRFQGKEVKSDSAKHAQHIFAKPLALTKLAHFLMDMHRSNNKWTGTKALPLVLLAENPQKHTYLVVGFEYPEIKGTFKKNRFGEKFELAAKTIKGEFKFDSFDAHVVEVNGDDVQRFIEHLHYTIDSTLR